MQDHTNKFKSNRANFLYSSMKRNFVNLKDIHREKALDKLQKLDHNPLVTLPKNYN